MANEFDFLSPGIKIREIDESVIPADNADDGPIIIGRTRKGPAMEPVRVKSLDAFIKTFGKPVAGGTALCAGQRHRHSAQAEGMPQPTSPRAG